MDPLHAGGPQAQGEGAGAGSVRQSHSLIRAVGFRLIMFEYQDPDGSWTSTNRTLSQIKQKQVPVPKESESKGIESVVFNPLLSG